MEYWGSGLYAWKNGVTGIGENQMNNLIAAQSSILIFDGSLVNSNTGGTGTEYNLSLGDQSVTFSISSGSTIGRMELEIVKYGAGADLILEIRQGSNVLKEMVYPAKLFSSGYISLPINLSNLSTGTTYTLVLKRNGDSTNHLRWVGHRRRVYSNTVGSGRLIHGIYGENAMSRIDYDSSGLITEIWRWLPAPDGDWMICERIVPTYLNDTPVRWEVS